MAPARTARSKETMVFSGNSPAAPRCPKIRGRGGAKKSVSNARLTPRFPCPLRTKRAVGETSLALHRAFVRTGAGGSEVASTASRGVMAAATRMTNGQAIAPRSTTLPGSKAGAEIGKSCERQFILMPQVVEQLAHPRRHLMVYP